MTKRFSLACSFALALTTAFAQSLAPMHSGKAADTQDPRPAKAGHIRLAPSNKFNIPANEVFSYMQKQTAVKQQKKAPKHIEALPNVADELLLYGLNYQTPDYRTPSPLAPTVFSFQPVATLRYHQEATTEIQGAMAGFYAKGKYYAIYSAMTGEYDENWNSLLNCYIDIYDANTWQKIDTKVLQEKTPDWNYYFRQTAIYDPVSDKAYAVTWGTGKPLVSLDLNTFELTELGPTDQFIQTLIVDKEGNLYGIAFNNSTLFSIDKTTGACTEVGTTDTGMAISANVMSAATDPVTGTVYWTVMDNNTFKAALFTIDLTTAHCEKVADLPGGEVFMGLYIPYAKPEAPAAPTAISYADGKLRFTVPTTTYTSGAALTGDLTAIVSIDGNKDYFEVTPGMEAVLDQPLSEGAHMAEISIANDAGTGPMRRLNTFVGQDVPAAVLNLAINADDGRNIVLTWDAPTATVNGGPVNDADLNYQVVRYPDEVVVADNLKETTFSEPMPTARNRYYYEVIARNGDKAGESATTDFVSAGAEYVVPFTETFDTQADFDAWTVIDANNDGQTWTFMNGSLYLMGNGVDNPETGAVATFNDDYLISLPMQLKAGNDYRITFKSLDQYMYFESLQLMLTDGASTTITGNEKLIADVTLEPNKDYVYIFNVEADGAYRLILHANTVGNSVNITMDDIAVDLYASYSGPAKVDNLKAEAAPMGELKNTLTFNAPTKTYRNEALTAITNIDIYKDGAKKAVKTFEAPNPGDALTWVDDNVTNGMHTYRVVAFNEEGQGEENLIENWVGLDVPGSIPNIKARMNENKQAEVTWEKVGAVGEHGGYVNPDDVKYQLYRYNEYNWDNHWEQASDLTTDFTLTDADKMVYWQQEFVNYMLVASNAAGPNSGDMFGIVLGEPYTLPYEETFDYYGSAGINNACWTLFADTYYYAWKEVDGNGLAVKPYQGDKGMLMFSYIDDDSNNQVMTTPRVDLSTAVAPELSFYMYHGFEAEPEDLTLTVMANYDDEGWQEVATIPYNNGCDGWSRTAIQLTTGKNNVQFALQGQAADASAAIYIDAFKVDESVAHDIAMENIAISEKRVDAGKDVTITVGIANYGTEKASGYTVELYRDGEKVAEQAGVELENNETAQLPFEVKTTKHDASKTFVYSALAVAEEDANEANDATKEVKLFVKGNSLPTAENLQGVSAATGVALTWEAPATDERTDAVTDGFDDYDSFIIEGIGDWLTYDGDGTQTVYFGGPDIANAYEPKAWQVWAPVEAGFSLERFPVLTPKSGDKILACWAASNGVDATLEQDDWLISSDVLGGTDVNFWYRVPNDGSDPQVFEILYSTTDQEPENFIVLDRDSLGGTTDWRQFEYTLPADAKYFAIRNCSYGSYTVAFIDDMTYTPLYGSQSKLTLKGYNVYRDDELIATEVNTLSYIDKPEVVQGHTYAVAAVWAEGESNLSNDYVSEMGTTGISSAATSTTGKEKAYNAAGQRTGMSQRGFRIVTVDNKTRKIVVK